jgi:hypothetical protein
MFVDVEKSVPGNAKVSLAMFDGINHVRYFMGKLTTY